MKKTVKMTIAILVLVLGIGSVGYMETHYTRIGTIVEINGSEVVIDDGHNEWIWIADSDSKIDFKVGSEVKMNMYTHDTARVCDDEILSLSIR